MGKRKRAKRSPKAAMSKPRANWISTAILRSLAGEAKELIEAGIGGYHSLTEFINDSARRRLEQLNKSKRRRRVIPESQPVAESPQLLEPVTA
jgi:hypothetical protein